MVFKCVMAELTDKQRLFVSEYLANGFNATKAYSAIYGCDDESARRSGSRMLTNVDIREALDDEIALLLPDKREQTMKVLRKWNAVLDEGGSENIQLRASEFIAKYYLGLGGERERNDNKIDELLRKLDGKE